MQPKAMLVGNSDSIGLATTKRLLAAGWDIIGVSSLAVELLSAEAPSYHASKAGFSNYLGGLALALKPKGVYVTNVRLGFVDTKMAKGDFNPFMMSD